MTFDHTEKEDSAKDPALPRRPVPEDQTDNFINPIISGWKIENLRSLEEGVLSEVVAAYTKNDSRFEKVQVFIYEASIIISNKHDTQEVEITLGHNPTLFEALFIQSLLTVAAGLTVYSWQYEEEETKRKEAE